eukprot:3600579-Rhodomonas_salina.1
MQAIGIAEDQNILRAGTQAATASRAKAATANAAKAAAETPPASMQEQLDKHLAEVKAMLDAQTGCGGGNGGRAGGDGKKRQCRDRNGKQPDGTYSHPECTKCGRHHLGGAAACIKGRNLHKEKADLENLLKIRERARARDNKENGGQNAAERRQANAAAAAAKVLDGNKSPDEYSSTPRITITTR